MNVDKKVVRRWTREQAGPGRRAAMPVILLGLAGALIAIGQAWTLAEALADCLTGRSGSAWPSILVFAVLVLIRSIVMAGQELASSRAGIASRRRLRLSMLASMVEEGPALLRRQHSGVLASTIVDRIEALDGYFSRWLPASVLWMAIPAIILAGVAFRNLDAALVLACCGAMVPVAQAVFGIGAAIASRDQFLAMTRLQARFLDRIRGIATIVLAGAADREAQTLALAAGELRQRTMRVLRVAFLSSAAIDVAMVVAIIAIVISQRSQLLVFAGNGAAPEGIAAALFGLLLTSEFFAPFRSLALAYQDRAHAAAAADAMQHLLPAGNLPSSAPLPRSGRGLAISMQNVDFSWQSDRGLALQHINITIAAGETVILTGASGSGKSTLMELLLGFVAPSRGRILFDGTDIATLSPRDVAASVAWIGQRPVLFAGTMRDNILFARPSASEQELVSAVNAAAIDRFVDDLPHGLNTVVGEGGFGLSGGQAQRIAIARAYLKNAPLLLLDEPTAHLDPETEGAILGALRVLAEGRTVVLCGHSDATRNFGGRVLELDHGHVVLIRGAA